MDKAANRTERHIPVQSSHIASVAYDEGTQRLQVEFKDGAAYDYMNVTYEMFQELMRTVKEHESVGHWLHANIRAFPKRYPYVRVREKERAIRDSRPVKDEG